MRNKTAPSQLDGASSAPPPQRVARGKRRRRSSVDPDLSQDEHRAGSQQMSPQRSNTSKVSRKKRTKRTDSEQLTTEVQESLQTAQPPASRDTPVQDNIAVVVTRQEQSTAKKHRAQPTGPIPTGNLTPPDSQNSHGQMQASSAFTSQLRQTSHPPVSPAPDLSHTPMQTSFPTMVEQSTEHTEVIEELQFTPLRALVSDRQRRQLRRSGLSEEMNRLHEHDREDAQRREELAQLRRTLKEHIDREKELQWEVEQLRQARIEVSGDEEEELVAKEQEKQSKIQNMEKQLKHLQSEIHNHKQQVGFLDDGEGPFMDVDAEDPMSGDDRVDLELVDPADLGVSHDGADVVPYKSGIPDLDPEQDSNLSLADPTHEDEVRNFKQAIARLTREAADAKAALQALSIELQSLGFMEDEAPNDEILSAIRTAFHEARTEMEELLPNEMPNFYRNGPFLKLLMENIRRLLNKVEEQTGIIRRHRELEQILNTQNKGLIDHIATIEAKNEILQVQWTELDKQSDTKSKQIVNYESTLSRLQKDVDTRDNLLREGEERSGNLESDLNDANASNIRLQKAVNSYREEVTALENLISRMEEEQNAKVAHLEEVNNATVSNLQEQLDVQRNHREVAEQELDEKSAHISELQVKIESIESELDELREQLAESKEYGDAERHQREDAEAELDKRTSDIAALEARVEALENNLDILQSELEQTQALLDSEKRQRAAAETEMDKRGEKISELEKKLHERGTQANELRQKLFEAQQQNDNLLQELASAETTNETLQDTLAERNARIEQLEKEIKAVTDAMDELAAAKDALDEAQRAQIRDLEETLAEANADYDRLEKDKDEAITALQEELAAVSNTAKDHAQVIKNLQKAVTDADTANQSLADKNAKLTDDIASLEAMNLSLERRVEEEAEQMLEMQDANAKQVGQLQSNVTHRDKRIKALEDDALTRKQEYNGTVVQRDEQIKSLKMTLDARATQIASLSALVSELKRKHAAQAEDGKKTMDAIIGPFRDALMEAEKHGREFGEQSDESAVEVANIASNVEDKALKTSKPGKVNQHLKVVRKSARKRKFDSGFGAASDEEEELTAAVEAA